MDAPSLLVVDDDPGILAMLVDCLRDTGHPVAGVASVDAAVAALARDRYALVLADAFHDLLGPHDDRWAALESLRRAAAPAPVVIVSGHREETFAGWAERGFAGHLPKPFDLGDLLATVRECLGRAAP